MALSGVAASGTIEDLENNVDEVFGEKVAGIIRGALGVRKIVGEEISTTEFEVLCPRHGQPLVASMMENVDDTGGKGQVNMSSDEGVSIMCTTDLGLRRHGKKATIGDGEEEWEESVLLKAKVVLPTLLEDFVSQSEMASVEVSELYLLSHHRL